MSFSRLATNTKVRLFQIRGSAQDEKMKQDIDIDKLVSENRIDEVTAWLTEKIHKYGMLLTPAQLIENACGEEFNADYYIEYLTEKYNKIYDLK